MLPTGKNASIEVKARAGAGTEAVAVFVTEGSADAGEAAQLLAENERAAVSRLLAAGVALGKLREVQLDLLDTPGEAVGNRGKGKRRLAEYRRVLVVGLGRAPKLTPEVVRQAAGALAKAARRMRLVNVAVALPVLGPHAATEESGAATASGTTPAPTGPAAVAEAVAGGLLLASFEYDEYRGTASRRRADDEEKRPEKRTFTLLAAEKDLAEARRGAERGRVVAEGQNFARTIASRPGNDINPPTLAKVTQELAREVGLTCTVMDEKQLARLKMGGILAVGSGSIASPPRMIVLEWKGGGKGSGSRVQTSASSDFDQLSRGVEPGSARARGKHAGESIQNPKSKIEIAAPLLVVGKAITFDTGGISIKPADKMGRMIFDKSGGMAVLGLMYAVARLKLPVHVVGILSSAENVISSRSYRPGDILRMYNGVTVDVTNTDAEGRLVLGDALAWGVKTYKPAAVVDLATLTGACVVALGHVHAGLFCNSDALATELADAATAAGEKVWRMPLTEEYRERIRGDSADIVNAAGRDGGACTAAAFLSFFVPGGIDEGSKNFVPWAHLDIAGVADTEKDLPYYAKGSTGWGVRTLVEWVSGKVEPRVPHAAPRAAGG